MAKNKSKKGVKTYLLILILAIVATFLILITIMLFSPFKNIIGFKYFVYKEDVPLISNVTGGKADEYFDFSTIDTINVDCSYANVKVERYYKIDHYSIEFERAISGFARSDHDTDFNYDIYYTDDSKTELNIDVHEPEGFLFFSKNVTIRILLPTKLDYTLDDTTLNITNTTGDIYIGNNVKVWNNEAELEKNYVTFGTLNINTNKGRTVVLPYTQSISNLSIRNLKGDIKLKRDLTVESCKIYSEKSDIDLQNLTITGLDSKFTLKNAKFYAPSIVGILDLSIKNGYFDVDSYNGALSSNSAVVQMSEATITISEFSGYLSLPYANSTRVNLGTVSESSQIYIDATKGNVKINELKTDIVKIKTTEGDIKVNTTANDLDIQTTSGDINVTFDSLVIADQLNIVSKSGEIKLKISAALNCILEFYNAKGEAKTNDVKVEGFDRIETNSLTIGSGTKIISLKTNEHIDVNFF